MNELMNLFKTDKVDEIVRVKLAAKKAEPRAFEAKKPALIELTSAECKRLCTSAGVNYLDGYESRVLQYRITNEAVDRYGDIIRASGGDWASYRKNPVINLVHDNQTWPVGNSIKLWHDKEQRAWMAWGLFQDERTDPTGRSDATFKMARAGFMKACSISFIPKESRQPAQEQRVEWGMPEYGVEYTKWEGLEWSPCSVQANPDALQDSMVMKSFNDKDIKAIRESRLFTDDLQKAFENAIKKAKKPEGSWKYCVCDECGYWTEHKAGEPCEKCPDCDTQMHGADEKPEKAAPDAATKPAWDETDDMIRYRVKDPGDFREDTFRTVVVKKDKPRIKSVMGKLKKNEGQEDDPMTVQNLMFPKEDGWDMTSAKAWLAEHPDIKKAFNGWVECAACHEIFNYLAIAEIAMGAVACPACTAILDQNGKVLQAPGTKDFADGFKALVESNKNLVEQLTSMEMQIKKYVEAMQHALDVHSDPEKFGGTAGDSDKVLAEINQLLNKQ